MKKSYIRPLAEVMELEVNDVITASSEFSTKLGDKEGAALSEKSLDAYVNDGRIVLN